MDLSLVVEEREPFLATMRYSLEVAKDTMLVVDVARAVTSKEIVQIKVRKLVEMQPMGESLMTGG